jgi:LmbE family N-acetylglucosaminyl deacetylase
MYVVAHQDDTLLFLSPALPQDIQAGLCVRSVFLTAGDDGKSQSYWGTREQGVEAAYAQMAGAPDTWTASTLTANGHPIQLETLAGLPNVSLVFMRLPDGGYPAGLGNPLYGNQSLMQLWNSGNGATPAKSAIAAVDGSTTYGYQDLIETLAALITSFQPQTIATQNFRGSFNNGDHNDHIATAYFTRAAQKLYSAPHQLIGYEDYEDESRPANVFSSLLEAKSAAFFLYGSFDSGACASASACAGTPYVDWLSRQYVAATETVSPEETNVAPLATATASSQAAAFGQTASKAIDGKIDGYPGNYEAEWATEGGKVGSTLTLKWSKSYSLDRVVLFDRPNSSDQITSGKLTFSDGSSVIFGSLPNAGSPGLTVSFPAHATTSLQMSVTGVSATTSNVGLAEIQAFGVPAEGGAPPAEPPPSVPVFTTANSGAGVVGKALSISFEATGVPTPTLSLSGSAPSGLKFTALSGGKATLSGTPTSAGSSALAVAAKNSAGTTKQTFTLTITKK